MSYEPTNWKAGDTITSAKLNKIEQGIAAGGVFVVGSTLEGPTMTLDKTWKEIADAMTTGFAIIVYDDTHEGQRGIQFMFIGLALDSGQEENSQRYMLNVYSLGASQNYECVFTTASEDGYPVYSFSEIPSGGELNPGGVIPEDLGPENAN